MGTSLNKRQMRYDMLEIANKLFLRGESTQDISKKLGVSELTIRQYLTDRQSLDAEYTSLFSGGVTLSDSDRTHETYMKQIRRGY
jgi:AcrR family transcriptional regulator